MIWQLGDDYKNLSREIEDLENEIRHSWTKLKYPSRSFMTPGRISKTYAVCDGVAAVIDLETILNKKVEKLKALRLNIEETIDSLPSVERRLMRMRYIRGFTWQQIAQRLYCDESSCRRLHRRILRELEGA
ncbi:MAG: sigma factor-like helix-turn-helix DNA-binding protein [Bacillota bacterium]|nr:sigma factor-like helix-turn-helix DNA-binding protein [Bacillota bacterium]